MEERMRRIPTIAGRQLRPAGAGTLDGHRRSTATSPRGSACRVDQIRLLLYSAFGTRQVSTIYAPGRHLSGDPRGRSESTPTPTRSCGASQIRTPSGALVPLDTVAKRSDKPTSLTVNHIAQLPSVIISFNLAPGVALGEAVRRHHAAASEDRPAGHRSPPASRAARRSSSRRSPTRACCCSPPCW